MAGRAVDEFQFTDRLGRCFTFPEFPVHTPFSSKTFSHVSRRSPVQIRLLWSGALSASMNRLTQSRKASLNALMHSSFVFGFSIRVRDYPFTTCNLYFVADFQCL